MACHSRRRRGKPRQLPDQAGWPRRAGPQCIRIDCGIIVKQRMYCPLVAPAILLLATQNPTLLSLTISLSI